jgi:hypothetical protein
MSNELIRKAYKLFNGVWPYKDNFNMIARSQDGTVEFYYTSTPFDAFSHDSALWHWVGTKADFEAYGESLKGEWMPEVGKECELRNDQGYGISYGEDVIGKKVTVESFFVCEYGSVPMVAISYYGNCYCFRQDMLHPLKTESEKQADEMFDIVKDATDTYHACELLVQGGYKKC